MGPKLIRFPWQENTFVICRGVVTRRGPDGQMVHMEDISQSVFVPRSVMSADLPDAGFVTAEIDIPNQFVHAIHFTTWFADALEGV